MTLDATVLDSLETHRHIQGSVKSRLSYKFPDGFNSVNVLDKCRELHNLDDFDTVYNLTIKLLKGKTVVAELRDFNGTVEELYRINAPDWDNLRGVEAVNSYPVLIVWLTDIVAGHIIGEVEEAWKKSTSAAAGRETSPREDPFDTGDKAEDLNSSFIVKEHFGDELLYACYEFYDRFKNKPENWHELFDFLRLMKVKSIFRDIAMSEARALQDE
jgi:hypothetical protein